MKKFLLTAMLVFICIFTVAAVGCNSTDNDSSTTDKTDTSGTETNGEVTNPVQIQPQTAMETLAFGEKYCLGDSYIIFKKDKTGIYHRNYNSIVNDKINSYSIVFAWEEASNHAIYLFFDHVEYDDEHLDSENITSRYLPHDAIYYAEDFCSYTNVGEFMYTNIYIREGSRLDLSEN